MQKRDASGCSGLYPGHEKGTQLHVGMKNRVLPKLKAGMFVSMVIGSMAYFIYTPINRVFLGVITNPLIRSPLILTSCPGHPQVPLGNPMFTFWQSSRMSWGKISSNQARWVLQKDVVRTSFLPATFLWIPSWGNFEAETEILEVSYTKKIRFIRPESCYFHFFHDIFLPCLKQSFMTLFQLLYTWKTSCC